MVDQIVQGLLLGGLYATTALGLSLVFGVLGMVNLAHGEMLIGGAYLTSVVLGWGGGEPLLVAVLVAVAFGVALYPVQRLVLTPVMAYGQEPPLVATFGFSVAAQSLLLMQFTANPRIINASYSTEGWEVFGTRIRVVLFIATLIGIAMVAAVHYGLQHTRFGHELKAAAFDPDAAATVGINVPHVYGVTLGIAAATATIGGTLIALAFSVTPNAGTGWLLRAFTAIVIGGMGSVPGTLVGAFVVGIAEALGAEWFGPQYRDVVVFGLLVIILLVRPQGLFARRTSLTATQAAATRHQVTATTSLPRTHRIDFAATGGRHRENHHRGSPPAILVYQATTFLSRSDVNRATTLMLLAAIAMAWNLIGGFGGQFSLGHSIFIGAGGYTTAVLLDKTELPLVAVIIASGALATAAGVVLVFPLMRLRGPYFAIGTLGISLAVVGWMLNWDYTKASTGYSVPVSKLISLDELYRIAAVVLIITITASVVLVMSPLGLRLRALRDDEAGATSFGRASIADAVTGVGAELVSHRPRRRHHRHAKGRAGAELGVQSPIHPRRRDHHRHRWAGHHHWPHRGRRRHIRRAPKNRRLCAMGRADRSPRGGRGHPIGTGRDWSGSCIADGPSPRRPFDRLCRPAGPPLPLRRTIHDPVARLAVHRSDGQRRRRGHGRDHR